MWGLGYVPIKIYIAVLCDVFLMYVNGIVSHYFFHGASVFKFIHTVWYVHLNRSFWLLVSACNPLFYFFLFWDGHPACLWLLDTIKKIIHWIPLYLHLYNAVWALLWNTDPRVALLDDWACASSTWLSASFSPPEELCRSVLLPTGHEESMYPHPCQHLALRSFLIVVSLIGIKGDVIVLVSMITPEFEHLYRCLWAFWVFLLYKLPVDVFYPLF